MKYDDPRPDHRPFWGSLFFTWDGELDLSWLFVFLMGLGGVIGFLFEVFNNGHGSIAGWAFLGAAFSSVLIAAIPVAKAKILAESKVSGEVAKGIACSTPDPFVSHEWTNEVDSNAGII